MVTSLSHAPTVLVVEDYPPGMFVITMMLECLGYAVVGVATGQDAIEQVRIAKTPFIAILMDVNLADMDGFEVTKAIRHLEEASKTMNTIIAVTAHVLAGDRIRCLEAGMNGYISKPIQPDILKQKLSLLTKRT